MICDVRDAQQHDILLIDDKIWNIDSKFLGRKQWIHQA